MSEEIFKNLQQIISEAKPNVKIRIDSHLREDMGFDSLDIVSFFFEVEAAFNIKITEDDIADNELFKIDNIIKFIENKVKIS